jgi:hypothetical protein
MIAELYDKITTALRETGAGLIRHIDLWNQNVEFIDQDDPWDRPAVFVEFGEIRWDPLKGPVGVMRGKGEVLLHIVTDWKGSAAEGSPARDETLADYELANLIYEKMTGLQGTTFRNVNLSRTLINHNHQEILENIEVYNVTYERKP